MRREKWRGDGAWEEAHSPAPLAPAKQNHFWPSLNDVLEAEGAITGQAFVLASPTQVLTVGAFRVHMAKSDWAGTSSSFTTLKNQSEKQKG